MNQMQSEMQPAMLPEEQPQVVFSVIVPVHNEQEVLRALYLRVRFVMESVGEAWELILVDDGSRDESAPMIRGLHEEDARVRGISFSRNFGFQAAVTAGLDIARGQAIILMDADLQDPPEVIPQFIAKWREGYQVVYGVRSEREGETAFKKATAAGFYRLVEKIATVRIPVDTGDFRLMDRRVADVLRSMPEHNRFLRGMVSWAGFKQTGVSYKRQPRLAGQTKFTPAKMFRFALDAVTSFSHLPLQLAGWAGAVALALGILGGLVLLILGVSGAAAIPGWEAALLVSLFVLAGVILLCLGILGEYVARMSDEGRRRPLYLVAERWD